MISINLLHVDPEQLKLERRRARCRRNYYNNREKRLTQCKEYAAANKEKRKIWHSAYRDKHRLRLREVAREWHYNNIGRSRAQNKKSRDKQKHVVAAYARKRNYGITIAQYNELLIIQDRRCAICKTDNPSVSGRFKNFAVDHCHTTGQVRGLLCFLCNVGLGRFHDDPNILREAANYIERYRCE